MVAQGVKDKVDHAIKENKLTVFQKTWCPACKKAREVLDALAKGKYAIINLDKDEEQDQMQNYLQEITGARTVPRIFIDGNCIGGCDECLQMQKSGKLQSILKEKEIV